MAAEAKEIEEESYSIAPCGIYCFGICPIFIADKGDHGRLKEILAAEMKVTAQEIKCDGCLSPSPFVICQTCNVRGCIVKKEIEGCYVCDEFPCKIIEDGADVVGRKAILRAVPLIRELGKEQFMKVELEHYQCPLCGYQLFMGARKCHNCKNDVEA